MPRTTCGVDRYIFEHWVLRGEPHASADSPANVLQELVTQHGLADRWRGLRQDSGDPIAFIGQAKAAYEKLGIDHTKKLIVFSDSLNVDSCIKIKKVSDEAGFLCTYYLFLFILHESSFFSASFGVGTSLTTDFKFLSTGEKSKATNIVIKLSSIDGRPCIKISDDLMKVRLISGNIADRNLT
jgi:nicotinate phosphoribosyltransferase